METINTNEDFKDDNLDVEDLAYYRELKKEIDGQENDYDLYILQLQLQ